MKELLKQLSCYITKRANLPCPCTVSIAPSLLCPMKKSGVATEGMY